MSRYAGAVAGLYVLNTGLFLLLIAVYALATVVVSPAGRLPWLALLAGRNLSLARHYQAMFYASETAMFQARLAHADYAAAPPVVWPESPLAESIGNAPPRVHAESVPARTHPDRRRRRAKRRNAAAHLNRFGFARIKALTDSRELLL